MAIEYLRNSEQTDVEYLAKNLRTEDEEEVIAGGFTPVFALQFGLDHSSPCFTGLDPTTGNPAFMAGTSPCEYYTGFGRVWLLGTDAIARNPKRFLRHSHEIRDMLLAEYSAVYNYTYEKNTLHHNWLRWLGFTFLRRVELTPNNFFYEFVALPSTS